MRKLLLSILGLFGLLAIAHADFSGPPVRPITCATHQWISSISGGLIPACSQPGYSDLSGYTSLTTVTNALSGDVALNNTSNYFDGPSAAQGTTGTWFASGTVTLQDTAGAGNFPCKLWDGTTVISSNIINSSGANVLVSETLSGVLATPAANIRISCRDASSTSGKIIFNLSGNSKDSSITTVRTQ